VFNETRASFVLRIRNGADLRVGAETHSPVHSNDWNPDDRNCGIDSRFLHEQRYNGPNDATNEPAPARHLFIR
jgi:hypothetical protein